MRFRFPKLGVLLSGLVLLAGMSIAPANAGEKKDADKPQTLTGEVSDAMCGAHHMMEGGKAECTRACVTKGSKYALVVGDKVYTLEGGDKAALDKLAGQTAKVTGTVKGDTIQVTSVSGS